MNTNNHISSLASPVNGTCIPLKDVKDPVFANETMGKGIAFQLKDGHIYSPVDGTVNVIADAKYAVGITSDDGLEILIHCGFDTVNLKGEGFEAFVKQGDQVSVGDLLIQVDLGYMEDHGIDTTTPMIFTNSVNYDFTFHENHEVKKGDTNFMTYTKKQDKSINKKRTIDIVAQDIIQHVGGNENILSLSHCMTRLRFSLKDETKADSDYLSSLPEIMQVVTTGGQYQVVIGPKVREVYDEIMRIGNFSAKEEVNIEKKGKEENLVSRAMILISGIFQPLLGLMMACGMIKAVLSVCTLTGILSADSGTYTILAALGDSIFYFFPILLGWTSAQKFGLKPIYGMILGACLEYPSIVALSSGEVLYTVFQGTMFASDVYVEFFGLPVILPSLGYTGTVIPIILITFVCSKIFKFFDKHLPDVIRHFLVPFLTILITMPLALLIIGPVAMFIQDLLGVFVQWLIEINPGIAGLVLGTFWSLIVMLGLHWAVIPMFALNIAQFGFDIINPLIFSGVPATMGALIGLIIRTKSIEERNLMIPACISSFFGVNEPALYGILMPRKKVMWSSFIAAGIGAMIAGFCGSKLYAFGTTGPLGLPCFINPTGIDFGFIGLCIGALISLGLAFVAAMMIGDKKDIA